MGNKKTRKPSHSTFVLVEFVTNIPANAPAKDELTGFVRQAIKNHLTTDEETYDRVSDGNRPKIKDIRVQSIGVGSSV